MRAGAHFLQEQGLRGPGVPALPNPRLPPSWGGTPTVAQTGEGLGPVPCPRAGWVRGVVRARSFEGPLHSHTPAGKVRGHSDVVGLGETKEEAASVHRPWGAGGDLAQREMTDQRTAVWGVLRVGRPQAALGPWEGLRVRHSDDRVLISHPQTGDTDRRGRLWARVLSPPSSPSEEEEQ